MLRYRLSISNQNIDQAVKAFTTGQIISHSSGREQSVGLDADTYFPIGKHDIYGLSSSPERRAPERSTIGRKPNWPT